MNETIQNLISRRSIRKYKSEQIKEEELNLILEAGKYAATGRGLQSPVMIVIQDKEKIEKLSKLNASIMNSENDPFYGAPTVVLVVTDKNINTCVEDASLVIGNMMNAAFSIGVDSCWIHRAKEELETEEGKELLKECGLDSEKYIGVGHCILGYRDCELPNPKERKENYIIRI